MYGRGDHNINSFVFTAFTVYVHLAIVPSDCDTSGRNRGERPINMEELFLPRITRLLANCFKKRYLAPESDLSIALLQVLAKSVQGEDWKVS